MNFKELVQKVNLHVGLQGRVVSATETNFQAYLAEMVRTVWLDIQNKRSDWKFLIESVSFTTQPGQHQYIDTDIMSNAGNNWGVSRWIADSVFRGKTRLREVDWEQYRDRRDDYEQDENSTYFSIRDVRPTSLMIPTPTTSATIQASYYRTAQVLTNNLDEPIIPEGFHYLIVYSAAAAVSVFMGNPGLATDLTYKADKLEVDLLRRQIPSRKVKGKPIYRSRNHR